MDDASQQSNNISLDDDVLVKNCQRGDMESMTLLIARYQDRLYNSILKICSNPEDAAELTQETFVKVIENITKFRSRSSFYTWLFRVGVNLTITYCKRRNKIRMSSLDAPLDSQQENAQNQLSAYLACKENADPAELVQNREIRDILLETLANLDDNYRIVLVLRDIEGMSYQEIADVLEVELGTVKSRISRARSVLREKLQAVLT